MNYLHDQGIQIEDDDAFNILYILNINKIVISLHA